MKKEPKLIYISWDLKYYDDGDLVFTLDKFQVCSIFNIFTNKKSKPWIHVANANAGFDFVFYKYMNVPTNLKLVRYFLSGSGL